MTIGWPGFAPCSSLIGGMLTGHWQIIVFMLAMVAGVLLLTALEARRSR
jgi:hypothetical protein